MIHVESLALRSTLQNLGLSEEAQRLAGGTLAMLRLDPYACVYHHPLEDQLLLLMENTALLQQGSLSLDEVIAAAQVLSTTLSRLANHYKAHWMYDRAERVLDFSQRITDSLQWA